MLSKPPLSSVAQYTTRLWEEPLSPPSLLSRNSWLCQSRNPGPSLTPTLRICPLFSPLSQVLRKCVGVRGTHLEPCGPEQLLVFTETPGLLSVKQGEAICPFYLTHCEAPQNDGCRDTFQAEKGPTDVWGIFFDLGASGRVKPKQNQNKNHKTVDNWRKKCGPFLPKERSQAAAGQLVVEMPRKLVCATCPTPCPGPDHT